MKKDLENKIQNLKNQLEQQEKELENQSIESAVLLQKLNEDNYRLKLSIKERIVLENKMFQKIINKLQNKVKENPQSPIPNLLLLN